MEDTITIPKSEYDELLKGSAFLRALQAAGVDNWDGYGYAMSLIDDEE